LEILAVGTYHSPAKKWCAPRHSENVRVVFAEEFDFQAI
jgi:hypothetical protein